MVIGLFRHSTHSHCHSNPFRCCNFTTTELICSIASSMELSGPMHVQQHGYWPFWPFSLQWRHNERDSVSNRQLHDRLLNRLFRHRLKKTSKLRVTGLYAGNSPGEFPAQRASNAENVSIWWHHHVGIPVSHPNRCKCCNSTTARPIHSISSRGTVLASRFPVDCNHHSKAYVTGE